MCTSPGLREREEDWGVGEEELEWSMVSLRDDVKANTHSDTTLK